MFEYLSHYGLAIVQICVYMYFARLFFKKGKASRIIVTACLVSIPMPLINSLGNLVLNLVSGFVVVFIAAIIVYKEKLSRLIIMSLAIYVLNFLCEFATVFFASLILKDTTHNLITHNIFSVIYAFISLLLFFTITCVVKIILDKAQSKETIGLASSFRVVMLTAMTIVLGYYIMYSSQYYQSPMLSGIGLAIFILLIVVDVAVMLGSESDIKKYELAKNLEAMKLQEQYNIETIQQLEDNQRVLTKQAHDFKNHLLYIEEMIRCHKSKAELDEADAYVHGLVQDIGQTVVSDELGIKNVALRAMVHRLKTRCEEFGIEFYIDIRYSDFSFMPHQDVCSLFANAFDNSVWACQQIDLSSSLCKVITVDIEKRHDFVRVKIANTNTAPVKRNRFGFISQKDSTSRAGIGTQIMERCVQRYGGTIDMDNQEGYFIVVAVIPIVPPQ